jgi:23S rRNA (cytidine1920-2'-O)/16S rRNA (cytidine1409-2'-O)-methyltransferase
MSRARLDELLVRRGLAATRAEAGRLILAGRVRGAGGPVDKAGRLVPADAPLEVSPTPRYASRGGDKLAGALAALGVRAAGRICLDVGASTGGFTDCLLQAGARHVYAVDVGRGQLHPRLRGDPRVTVLEGRNARFLEPGTLGMRPGLATIDVSFISLVLVLPAVVRCLDEPEVLALVKPQFEVGRGRVGRGGVVRDPDLWREAVTGVALAAAQLGLAAAGVVASRLPGPKGNREFFLHLVVAGRVAAPGLAAAIETAVAAAP